jgi:hypothetical protein
MASSGAQEIDGLHVIIIGAGIVLTHSTILSKLY